MEMQPTQADAIAASIAIVAEQKRKKDCLDRQIAALVRIADELAKLEEDRKIEDRGMSSAIAEFILAYAENLSQDSSNISSAIAHNERLLKAAQSNIVVPVLHPGTGGKLRRQ
jgi:hypothetical protein